MKTKEDIINTVRSGKIEGAEIAKMEMESEISKLEKFGFSTEIGKKMLSRYFENAILDYERMSNHYKAFKDAFNEFIHNACLNTSDFNQSEFDLQKEELDFIASMYLSMFEENNGNPSSLNDEINNLEYIVISTTIAEYKHKRALKTIENLKNRRESKGDKSGILSLKDWFIHEDYIDIIFEQLGEIYEVIEPRKKVKYIGQKSDEAPVTAACYFAAIMIENGLLNSPIKRSSKMNQRKFLNHLSEFFDVSISEQHYSKFTDYEALNKDHICFIEIEKRLNSINI